MQQVCGRTVAMCELPTSGGLDNLHAMSANEADIGFAQVDTWADMQMSNENIAGLQAVLSLNFNYLHVVVAANGFAVAGESRFGGLLRGKPQYVLMERFSSCVVSAWRWWDRPRYWGASWSNACVMACTLSMLRQMIRRSSLSPLTRWPLL
jgi:hypothetical protein